MIQRIDPSRFKELISPATAGMAEVAAGILDKQQAARQHYDATWDLVHEGYRLTNEVLVQLATMGYITPRSMIQFTPSQLDSYGLRRFVMMYSTRYIQLAHYISHTFDSWNTNVLSPLTGELNAIGEVFGGTNGVDGLSQALEYILVADKEVFPPVRIKLGISTPFGDF